MLLNCGAGEDSESPLVSKEIQPVNPKGNQSWILIGRTDAVAETPIFWPPDAKNWLIEKDPDSGKDWRQEEMGITEDEMVGWHQRLDGHELEQFRSWWWTGKPGVLQSMGSQGVKHDWVTELNWTMWCWRKFLRVPWKARRSNQSILKEINPECLLEGLMLKL